MSQIQHTKVKYVKTVKAYSYTVTVGNNNLIVFKLLLNYTKYTNNTLLYTLTGYTERK